MTTSLFPGSTAPDNGHPGVAAPTPGNHDGQPQDPGDLASADLSELRDALHVPGDAGQYADDLEAILQRIPDGWGRWISCDRGWYSLLVELDRSIAAIVPDYVVHQVKEKFGSLSFYWAMPDRLPECCRSLADRRPPAAARGSSQDREWVEAWAEHRASAVHGQAEGSLGMQPDREAQDRVRDLVREASRQASATCEACGSQDQVELRENRRLYKTLCRACALHLGFSPVPD